MLAFLGRNARIVSEHDNEPVHIIMERVTSKTLDCYVEFVNFNEAVAAVNRFETNRSGGRGGRLGQRHVEVELARYVVFVGLFPKYTYRDESCSVLESLTAHGMLLLPRILPKHQNTDS